MMWRVTYEVAEGSTRMLGCRARMPKRNPQNLQGCAVASLRYSEEAAARGCQDPTAQDPFLHPTPPPKIHSSVSPGVARPGCQDFALRVSVPHPHPDQAGQGGGIIRGAWRED